MPPLLQPLSRLLLPPASHLQPVPSSQLEVYHLSHMPRLTWHPCDWHHHLVPWPHLGLPVQAGSGGQAGVGMQAEALAGRQLV